MAGNLAVSGHGNPLPSAVDSYCFLQGGDGGSGAADGLVCTTEAFLQLFPSATTGFAACYQQLRILKETESESDEDAYDLSAAWDNPRTPRSKKKGRKRWLKSARKRALKDQAEQAKIDAILAKVKEKGLHSLTWWEKRALKKPPLANANTTSPAASNEARRFQRRGPNYHATLSNVTPPKTAPSLRRRVALSAPFTSPSLRSAPAAASLPQEPPLSSSSCWAPAASPPPPQTPPSAPPLPHSGY